MTGLFTSDSFARTTIIDDVDAMAAAMADGLSAEYVQLEARPFEARWTTIATPVLMVQFATQQTAVLRRLRVPGDRCAFMIPLGTTADARWNARPIRPDDIIVCPPRSACFAFDPRATEFAIVTVDLAAPLAGAAGALAVDGAEPVTVSCASGGAALHARLRQLRDAVTYPPSPGVDPLHPSIATFLAFCLAARRSCDPIPLAAGSRNRIVNRADDFFRHHVSEGVSVAQLSTALGVSERCLRNAFNDVLTTSPKRYMRLWQLHQVRRALQRAEAETATVTDVATAFGLYELGRFAGAYKSLFGEAPSATLCRASQRRARVPERTRWRSSAVTAM